MCLFVSSSLELDVSIFFLVCSSICSLSIKIDGHLSLVDVAPQTVPPAHHPVPPATVYSDWKRCLRRFRELIRSARRRPGISVSTASAAGPFAGQGEVCASAQEGRLTLAPPLGFSLARRLRTSGPTGRVQNSG